ncbi:MAG: hypothetical protein CME06_06675 [Gemmatimonadetes bacterium]|nr:hypothetical protein [Gemmatimonadota bacterium]
MIAHPTRHFLAPLLLPMMLGGLAHASSAAHCGRAFPVHHAGEPPMRYAPDRPFDLLHTALELRIDPEGGTIEGTSAITASALGDDLGGIELHAVDLEIERVRLVGTPGDEGQALRFDYSGEVLAIDFPAAIGSGEKFTVTVDYRGAPRRGLYFVGPETHAPDRPYEVWSQGEDEDSRYWFPSWDYPNDRGTSSAAFTVDRRYTVVGNGRLVGVDERSDGTRTWRWSETHPHVTYLTSVVVAEMDEMHDTWRDISVDYYVPKGLGERIPRNLGATPAMMTALSEYLDFPYPYDKYAQVAVNEYMYGGMENIGATTLNANALRDAVAYDEGRIDGLVAHELAHQWFGDMITCRDWSHIWLNEGFATYGEVLSKEALDDWGEATISSLDDLDGYLDSGVLRPIVDRRYQIPMDVFDEHSYAKGSRVLHQLRFELGEALFQRALRHYSHSRAWQNVTTQDLIDAIEESTGRSMERFFDQWVRSPGHLELEVSWSWDDALSLARVSVRQEQDTEEGVPIFHTSFEVAVLDDEGAFSMHRGRLEGREKELAIPLGARPASVVFDPDGWLLASISEDLPAGELAERLELLTRRASGGEYAYPVARIRTARALGEQGDRAAVVESLREALEGDPRDRVRSAAGRALGAIGGDRAVAALVGGVEDRDPRVRKAVAEGLGHFVGEAEAEEALARIAERDPGYGPRAAAIRALVSIGSTKAARACRLGLGAPSFQEEIRRASLDGLIDIGEGAKAVKAARRFLKREPSSWVRSHSAAILGRHAAGLDERTEGPARRELRLDLQGLTHDANYHVRESAVEALGELGDGDAIATLRQVAASDPDVRMEQVAEDAIAEILGRSADRDDGPFELGRRLGELEKANEELEERIDRLDGLLEVLRGEAAD